MAIENWIDDLTKVWGNVESGKDSTVKSYSVFGKTNMPEDITVFPCAITTAFELSPVTAKAKSHDLWRGITEFHLVEDTSKKHYPTILRYFDRIREAAAANLQLGGLVANFLIDEVNAPGILGPAVLQWGSEAPHLGLIVNWIVKENRSLTITV